MKSLLNGLLPGPLALKRQPPSGAGAVPLEAPVLEGQRVLLRLPTMADAQDLFTYARDPQVARYVLWDAHVRLKDSQRALRGMIDRNRWGHPSTFALVLKAEGRMVGTVGFQGIDWQNQRAEVGYSLARRLWGHGLTAEALRLLVEYAFLTLGLKRLDARHDSRNPASGRVLEKAGFHRQGIEEHCLMLKGHRADMVWYALLREQFLPYEKLSLQQPLQPQQEENA